MPIVRLPPDFAGVQPNQHRSQGVLHSMNASLQLCLMQCKSTDTCTGVNYKPVGMRCEFQSAPNQCAPLTIAAGYLQYDLKSLLCTTGESVTIVFGLPHSTIYRPILAMPIAWLESDKHAFFKSLI